MLNNDWIITQVEKERLIFPTESMRATCTEIIYYYLHIIICKNYEENYFHTNAPVSISTSD